MPRKATKLTWKRQSEGHYYTTDGKWYITGEGRDWKLFEAATEEVVFSSPQKKLCQEEAQQRTFNGAKTPPKKTPPRFKGAPKTEPEAPPRRSEIRTTQAERLEKAVGDPSIGNLVTTLYLEVSGLKWSLERVLHSVEAVENALQKIVDPDKKMNRKQG